MPWRQCDDTQCNLSFTHNQLAEEAGLSSTRTHDPSETGAGRLQRKDVRFFWKTGSSMIF